MYWYPLSPSLLCSSLSVSLRACAHAHALGLAVIRIHN